MTVYDSPSATSPNASLQEFRSIQLWDWKTSIDLELKRPRDLSVCAKTCGWTIARAHARSGDPIAIAAYLGKSDRFDRALAEFAAACANLNELDHRALARGVANGRVTAAESVSASGSTS